LAVQERHQFAHCRYAWTQQEEDALLLIDPKQELLYRANELEIGMRIRPEGTSAVEAMNESDDNLRDFRNSIFAYSLQELKEILERIEQSGEALRCFHSIGFSPQPSPQADEYAAFIDQYLL
jgi:hypothetical protein